MNKQPSKLFKQLLNGYISAALKYNHDHDSYHSCALLYVDDQTLQFLARGVRELLRQDRQVEAKILMRILINNSLPYEELVKAWAMNTREVTEDEAGFREFLQPHNDEGEEIPIPF